MMTLKKKIMKLYSLKEKENGFSHNESHEESNPVQQIENYGSQPGP